MNSVVEIIKGYEKDVKDALWELVDYVVKNRGKESFDEVKNRCELVINRIDTYQNTTERAIKILNGLRGGS